MHSTPACILRGPISYSASLGLPKHLSQRELYVTGKEQREEAVGMLRSAHEILSTEFGQDYEPVSEAAFYLTLAQLPETLSPEDLQGIEAGLTQAGAASCYFPFTINAWLVKCPHPLLCAQVWGIGSDWL